VNQKIRLAEPRNCFVGSSPGNRGDCQNVRFGPIVAALASLSAAAPAVAASTSQSFADPHQQQNRRSKVDLRLFQDAPSDVKPIRERGMIAQTSIMHNAVVGLGVFKSAPKRVGPGEWRVDSSQTGGRKAAVKFVLKF
jgi:hypothetical protein